VVWADHGLRRRLHLLPAIPELEVAGWADRERERAHVRWRAPLALGALRARLPEAERPYRAPAAPVLAPLAFAVANLLILWSGWTTDWKLGVAILIGYVILAANRVFKLNPITPQFEIRSALWLSVYLVGMGAIVYLSDFGPIAHPWFPLWWDMLAVTVFSLAIYFWAQRVALTADKIEQLTRRGAMLEEPAVEEAA
jgi:hypothetical protein